MRLKNILYSQNQGCLRCGAVNFGCGAVRHFTAPPTSLLRTLAADENQITLIKSKHAQENPLLSEVKYWYEFAEQVPKYFALDGLLIYFASLSSENQNDCMKNLCKFRWIRTSKYQKIARKEDMIYQNLLNKRCYYRSSKFKSKCQ